MFLIINYAYNPFVVSARAASVSNPRTQKTYGVHGSIHFLLTQKTLTTNGFFSKYQTDLLTPCCKALNAAACLATKKSNTI